MMLEIVAGSIVRMAVLEVKDVLIVFSIGSL